LRIGGVYTYNADVIQAYGDIAHFATVSALTQWHLLTLLQDEAFVDSYLAQHAANLQENCNILCDGLDAIGEIEYTRPQVCRLKCHCNSQCQRCMAFDRS
jgi:aspartate/methionine/tyrosine aminotransferase